MNNFNFRLILLITGFYFIWKYCIKYFRLGSIYNIYEYFPAFITMASLLLLLLPSLYFWLILVIPKLTQIKETLQGAINWQMILLLKYRNLQRIAEYSYKISFIIVSFINYNPNVYKKTPIGIFRKIFKRLMFKYSWIFSVFIIIYMLIEAILNHGNIYYTIYLIYGYTIIRLISYLIYAMAMSNWRQNNCLADYLSLNWENPRYKYTFWVHFVENRVFCNNMPKVSEKLDAEIKGHISHAHYAEKEIEDRFIKLISRLNNGRGTTTLCQKHKIAYRVWSGVRWVHTSSNIWHPMTSLFAKSGTDYAACMNNHWSHFAVIQRAKMLIPYNKDINYNTFTTPKLTAINQIMEHNLITNFVVLRNKNYVISSFNKNIIRNTKNQAEDDLIIDPRQIKPPVLDQRVHGLDQKAANFNNIRDSSSKILSSVSQKDYEKILDNFYRTLINNIELSQEQNEKILLALKKLKVSSDNLDEHSIVWVEVSHLFPNNHIPPLRIPHNFSTRDLTEETRIALNKSNERMTAISNSLYNKQVPCDYTQAVEYLADCNIFDEI